jgi:protein SCO1/2
MKTSIKHLVSAAALAAAGLLCASTLSVAEEDAAPSDPHAHHHMMMHMQMPTQTARTTAEYVIPQVELVRDDGKTVSLPAELNDGRPVVLDFIFTSCTEICPLTSHTLAQLQSELGSDRDRVHLVSISIDPEEDTPAVLAAYAKKYGAGPEWQHYTGTLSASIATQRAFDAYRGDKMNHTPVTFVRLAPGQPWIRIDGFATADELLGELRTVLAAQ